MLTNEKKIIERIIDEHEARIALFEYVKREASEASTICKGQTKDAIDSTAISILNEPSHPYNSGDKDADSYGNT